MLEWTFIFALAVLLAWSDIKRIHTLDDLRIARSMAESYREQLVAMQCRRDHRGRFMPNSGLINSERP